MSGVDVLFHQAAIRITQCAEEPRLAVEVLVDGTYNVLEAAANAEVRKVVAASSASIYGLAEKFPTDEQHHPYANDTLYGAAKTFNEGLLRSLHAMYGLDYVALRYFNVYGPRMDVHGLYTEVLVRWMERISAGQPPLIMGDGLQTMDFVYIGDVARANLLAAQSDVTDAVYNVASGTETSLLELAEKLLARHGLGPERRARRPRAPSTASPGAWPPRTWPASDLGFEAEVDIEEGLARLVDWWRAERAGAPAQPVRDPGAGGVMEIPFTRPYFRGDEGAAVAEAIASGWVSQGPRVRAFEEAFAARVGAADAVATTNCTTALQLALYVAGVGPGDEVIVPSLSFIATANAVWQNGGTPVFADVDPRTGNIDASTVEPVITSRTKAIMPVHQIGLPADMDPLMELAREHGLAIVEDAACAIGATYKGRPIGSLGPLACFSLHPRKVITTGEGGMITVQDPAVAERLRQLRQHAMDVSDVARHAARDIVIESYPERGWNCRMTDMQAALGLCQLELLDEILDERRRLAERYTAGAQPDPAPLGAVRTRVRGADVAVIRHPRVAGRPGRPDRADALPPARRRRDAARRDGDPQRAGLRRLRCPAAEHRDAHARIDDAAAVPRDDGRAAGLRHRPARLARDRAGGVSTKPLLIVGGGGLARETLELVHAANAAAPTWRVAGVLDDDPGMLGARVGGVEVIGPSQAVHDHPDALVALCVASPGNPRGRLALAARLGIGPERCATLVHPTAVIPRSASLGAGSVLHAGVVLTADVTLGQHVVVMPAVVLTHDDQIGAGVTFGAGVRVAGGVTIEDAAYVGSGALLREHVVVGSGAVVGMGAVVTQAIPADEVWAGVPARRLRSMSTLVAC